MRHQKSDLGDLKNRGVVLNDGQTLKDLYDERTEYYEKYADVTVNEEGLSIRETIDAVKENSGWNKRCRYQGMHRNL